MLAKSREERLMARAIDIARRGEGKVSPNPLVGAILVYDNRIISEGWHEEYGKAHAEVNAILKVDPQILPKCEMFVSLEPCSHFGKTPPCSDLIIQKKIPTVYVACVDPNPLVEGKGIERLKLSGINVFTGILEKESRDLNRRFLTRIEKNRPYILLKWAQSKDGFIGRQGSGMVKISNEISLLYSHKLRSQEDAIIVGTNTVINDNPRLTNRFGKGKNPIRITIDTKKRIHPESNFLNQETKSIIYTTELSKLEKNNLWVKLKEDFNFLEQILEDLAQRNINSLLIEGGTNLLEQFLERSLYDEIHVFVSPKDLEYGVKSPNFPTVFTKSCKILKGDCYYFLKNN